jgi:hypothetical protein
MKEKNSLVKKAVVLSIVSMFIIVTFAGNVSAITKSKTPIPANTPWGFILKKEFTVTYTELIINQTGVVQWWGSPTVIIDVFGIGRHNIRYDCNYTVYTFDVEHMPQPQIGTIEGSTTIYLFNLSARPIIKLHAEEWMMKPFFLFKNGTWTGRLFIDDVLVDEQSFTHEHN